MKNNESSVMNAIPLKKVGIAFKMAFVAFLMANILGLTGCYGEEWTTCTSSSTSSSGSAAETTESDEVSIIAKDSPFYVEVTAPTHDQVIKIEEGDSVTLSVQVKAEKDTYTSSWLKNGAKLNHVAEASGSAGLIYTISNVTKDMDGDVYQLFIYMDPKATNEHKLIAKSPTFKLEVVPAGTGPTWYGGSLYDGNESRGDSFITVNAIMSDGTKFAENSRIGVFAWRGSASQVPTNRVVDGAVNTFDGSNWVARPEMLWADLTSEHYFLGIQQTKDPGSINDFEADPYMLPMNNDGTVNNQAADVLVATNTTGITATTKPVELVFDHIMAQLVVSLSLGADFFEDNDIQETEAGYPTPTVVLSGGYTEATIDYLDKKVAGANTGDVKLGVTDSTYSGDGMWEYSAIVIPNTNAETSQDQVVQVKVGDKTYASSSPVTLESGKTTTVYAGYDHAAKEVVWYVSSPGETQGEEPVEPQNESAEKPQELQIEAVNQVSEEPVEEKANLLE